MRRSSGFAVVSLYFRIESSCLYREQELKRRVSAQHTLDLFRFLSKCMLLSFQSLPLSGRWCLPHPQSF